MSEPPFPPWLAKRLLLMLALALLASAALYRIAKQDVSAFLALRPGAEAHFYRLTLSSEHGVALYFTVEGGDTESEVSGALWYLYPWRGTEMVF